MSPASRPPELPPDLAERFEPGTLLGQGGFGAVWRCRERQLDREVAVKLLLVEDEEQRARFGREAATAARVRHPGIVEVLDHGVTRGGMAFLVVELVDGCPLDQLDPPSPEGLRDWACQGAAALEALHQAGLVHRDVKPANVLCDRQGRLVLVDFGLARRRAAGDTMTAEGLICGTPAYMAPELWHGAAGSPASDQFAWAATLYRVWTGSEAYGASDPASILARLGQGWAPAVPPEHRGRNPLLERALERALAPHPGDRFPGLEAFAAAVAGQDGPPPEAAPTLRLAPHRDRGQPVPSPAGRGARLALAVGLAALTLAALVLASRAQRVPAPTPAPPQPTSRRAPDLERAVEELGRRWFGTLTGAPWTDLTRDVLADRLAEVPSLPVEQAWMELVRSLRAWALAVPGEPPGALTRPLAAAQLALRALLRPPRRGQESGSPEVAARHARIRAALAKELGSWGASIGEDTIALELLLVLEEPALGPRVATSLRRLVAALPTVEGGHAQDRVLRAILGPILGRALPEERYLDLWDLALEAAATHLEAAAPIGSGLDLQGRLLELLAHEVLYLRARARPPDWRRFDAALARVLRWGGPRDPEQVCSFGLHIGSRLAELAPETPAEVRPRLDAILRLMEPHLRAAPEFATRGLAEIPKRRDAPLLQEMRLGLALHGLRAEANRTRWSAALDETWAWYEMVEGNGALHRVGESGEALRKLYREATGALVQALLVATPSPRATLAERLERLVAPTRHLPGQVLGARLALAGCDPSLPGWTGAIRDHLATARTPWERSLGEALLAHAEGPAGARCR